MVDKRKILQPILDKIESGWQIDKPFPTSPDAPDTECVFYHPKTDRQARIHISLTFFEDGRLDEIERLVRKAIKAATKRG